MAGRAGRKVEGSVYVFEARDKLREIVQLMNEQLSPVQSALGQSGRSLARPLLEVISLNLVNDETSLRQYLTCSLIARQCSEEALQANVCECVGYLQSREVIHCYDYQGRLVIRASRLGRAISSSSLPLEESVLLFRDLFAHQSCVCLDSTLFLVYLITPTFAIPAFSWTRFDKVIQITCLKCSYFKHFLHLIGILPIVFILRRSLSLSAHNGDLLFSHRDLSMILLLLNCAALLIVASMVPCY